MIYLYRGDLHKVSGITRQWPLPKPTISLSAFRQALGKRDSALRESPVSLGVSSSCLLRQDTCISGSHNVSPSHPHTATGTEETERDIVGEGRGESDGRVKEIDYTDDDGHEEADDDDEDGSKHGHDVRHGSSGSNGEVGNRDGSLPAEDSSALILSRGHSSDDHECKHASKAEGAEAVEQGDHVERKLRIKRKREEGASVEAKKGKVKVKEDVAAGGVEPMVVDAEGRTVEMELDQKSTDKVVMVSEAAQSGGLDEVKEAGRGCEDEEGRALVTDLKLSKDEGEVKKEGEAEDRDAVKVEAPSTPPVLSEEENPGKPLQEMSYVEKKSRTLAVADKKAGLEAKLKVLTAEKHRLVQMLKQVLSTEESKKKVHSTSQSPPAPSPPVTSQAAPSSTDVPAAPIVQLETTVASVAEAQASADLEEGELEYARTPSPPSHTPSTSHSTGHGGHTSHGPPPSLGPLLGRQPQHMSQGGATRGGYYQQGLGMPSPNPAAAAAAVAGAISPGTGFMPIGLGGRPYQHMALQHAAALHAQKVAAAAAAAAAGHPHLSPILGGGGPAAAGNGVTNGPPGFGGYGVSPSVHGHHGHIPQGASPGSSHMAAQQGVVSPSLLTTPRGGTGYHDMRLGNPPWNLQR